MNQVDKMELTPEQEIIRRLDRIEELLNPIDDADVSVVTLTLRQAVVLALRFGLLDGRYRTLKETGKILGVTGSRIRQIEVRTRYHLQQRIEDLVADLVAQQDADEAEAVAEKLAAKEG